MVRGGNETDSGEYLSAGPEWGYLIPQARGWIEPFVFAVAGYDFGDQSSVVLADGTVFAAGKFNAKAGGGLRVSILDGWIGSISASYDWIGSESRDSWTASARLELPF